MSSPGSAGFTLVEMTVVIAVLAVTSLVAALALGSAFAPVPSVDQSVLEAQRQAIEAGTPVQLSDYRPATDVYFLPDGRAIGDGVDPLVGLWEAR